MESAYEEFSIGIRFIEKNHQHYKKIFFFVDLKLLTCENNDSAERGQNKSSCKPTTE